MSLSFEKFSDKLVKVESGAHIVNDVSCGLLDEDMFDTVQSLGT